MVEILGSLFLHAVIIISVYHRVKHFISALNNYKASNDKKAIVLELLLLAFTIIIAVTLFYFTLYKWVYL
jgi:hypothetical protein